MVDWTILESKRKTKNLLNAIIIVLLIPLIFFSSFLKSVFKNNRKNESNIYNVSAKSGIKLRAKPQGNIIFNIKHNEEVKVINFDSISDWTKISYKNQVGFAKKENLIKK